ncbi:hypothetical protein R3P38DRAFT_3168868 [Favolaschia claudopus]|uniref:Uncharacterized protein n=1 Tax=Favolaschia claudopus TaxID=2862362 RepID=A0AAW0DWJ7_9AGAR
MSRPTNNNWRDTALATILTIPADVTGSRVTIFAPLSLPIPLIAVAVDHQLIPLPPCQRLAHCGATEVPLCRYLRCPIPSLCNPHNSPARTNIHRPSSHYWGQRRVSSAAQFMRALSAALMFCRQLRSTFVANRVIWGQRRAASTPWTHATPRPQLHSSFPAESRNIALALRPASRPLHHSCHDTRISVPLSPVGRCRPTQLPQTPRPQPVAKETPPPVQSRLQLAERHLVPSAAARLPSPRRFQHARARFPCGPASNVCVRTHAPPFTAHSQDPAHAFGSSVRLQAAGFQALNFPRHIRE